MKKICFLCRDRKANRFCPSFKQTLCSQCCGQSRYRTVNCVEGCRFLIDSRRQALKRLINLSGDGKFELTWFEVLHNLRLALVKIGEEQGGNFTGLEAITALENVLDTLKVRSAKLIYEFKSPNPNVQKAIEMVTKVLEWHERGENGAKQVELSQLAACVRYLLAQVKLAKEKGINFLELIAAAVGRSFLLGNESIISR